MSEEKDDGWCKLDDADNPPPKDGSLIELWIIPHGYGDSLKIETPKTGKELKNIVFGLYEKAATGYWVNEVPIMWKNAGIDEIYGWAGNFSKSKELPTHWRPLSLGPKKS